MRIGTAILAAIVMLSGCAHIYDPMRLPPQPFGSSKTQRAVSAQQAVRDGACDEKTATTYEAGVNCAGAVRRIYLDAMVDDAVRSDRFAIALIPIGAAAIGLGVSGVSGNPLTGLALGGGAMYGAGLWLTSHERRAVFGVGAEACQCVIEASRPLNVSKARVSDIKTAQSALKPALGTLQTELDALMAMVEGMRPASATPAVRGQIQTAERVVASSEAALREGRTAWTIAADVVERVEKAGTAIIGAVQTVNLRVVRASVGTSQDLRDLPDHLRSAVYGTFQDIVGLGQPPSASADVREPKLEGANDLQTAIEKVEAAAAAVRKHSRALTLELETVSVTGVQAEFVKCLDALKGLKTPTRLRILPGSLVRGVPGETKRIVITGGTPPYSVLPLWSQEVPITLSGPPETGPARVDLKIGDDATTGTTHHLLVRDDASDVERTVRIEVTAKPKAPSTEKPGTTDKPAAPRAAADTKAQPVAIEAALRKKSPPASWTGLASGAVWKCGTVTDGRLECHLAFADVRKAADAKESAPARRIELEQKVIVTVKPGGKDLIAEMSESALAAVAKAANDGTWPTD